MPFSITLLGPLFVTYVVLAACMRPAVALWIRWGGRPPRLLAFLFAMPFIYIDRAGIVYARPLSCERLPWAALTRVDFTYHAAIGFTGLWLFHAHGREVDVHYLTPGITTVLDTCRDTLADFQRRSVAELVAIGDVEDTIVCWSREP